VRSAAASLLGLLVVGCGTAPLSAPAPVDAGPPPPRLVDTPGPPPVTEAGFLPLHPQEGAGGYPARMFYSFHPADVDPQTKPLFILFNGGPGYATSAGLMVYGTGPMTLAASAGDPGPPTANPASFTRFANLLYLDERQTGFSYGLDPNPAVPPKCPFSAEGDATDFVEAVVEFLEAHPSMRAKPVVQIGRAHV